jgi:transposase
MSDREVLTDAQWQKFRLAMKRAGCRITTPSVLRNLRGILYYLREGCSWRSLPARYGNWKTVHSRFSTWSKTGVLYRVFLELRSDPDFEWVSLDSTSVKVHQDGTGAPWDNAAIGRSRGGRTTKIHAVVDALGNPVDLIIGPGNEADNTVGVSLIRRVGREAKMVLADKAYDSQSLRDCISEQCALAVIPSKKTEKFLLISTRISTKQGIRSKTSFNE